MMAMGPSAVLASTILAADANASSPLLAHFGIAGALAFLPFLVIAGTSFIKISLVLAILRSALGAPGVPPASVITALAAVLSMFVMAPVGADIASALEAANLTAAAGKDAFGLAEVRTLWETASPPLMDFLRLNTPASETQFFSSLAGLLPDSEPGFRVLLPAFAVGEVVEAFLIGFLVFIPFLVIDLIVANTLLALGMHMMSPTAVSLPLKLLLFVAVDGWHILLSGLLVNYSM